MCVCMCACVRVCTDICVAGVIVQCIGHLPCTQPTRAQFWHPKALLEQVLSAEPGITPCALLGMVQNK